jgi:hypothetical protein
MKRNLLFAALFLLAGLSHAQEFGGFPPSTRWKQINTDTARVIFMPGAEDQAQRVASLLHRMAADTPVSLGGRLRKIDVVLHSRTTLANGYVALAPFRSEFFLVPGSSVFDFGNLPWNDNLAIHEYRHVQQFNNFRNGISKAFYYLFGERGQALVNVMAVPDWFWEGDAVYAETALTPQGRGRLPYFLSGYNSLWLAGKDYSWMKLRNGSFKDYVPNHYQLGYLLVNYGYLKYGPSFWQKVTHDATSFKGLLYPFQRAVKTHSGVDFKTFRQQALDYYRRQLGATGKELPDEGRTPDNYFFPQYIGSDSLLYLRSAYDRIAAFYIRTASGEHRIAQKSIGSEEWFSYRNGTIAYTAYKTDARWALVDYSDIVLLDINTRREKRITQKQRYFTPDLSPSGNRIVAIHTSDSLLSELRILDRDGQVLQRMAPPEPDAVYFNPRFVDESRIITAVRTGEAQMSWMLFDLNATNGKPGTVSPSTYSTVGLPQAEGDTVYFTANYGGNDDLYALRLRDKKLYRLTADSTGNYYGHVSGDSIVYSKFTASGLRLRTEALSQLMWRETQPQAAAPSPYPVALAGRNLLSIRGQRFAEKRYEKSTGFFRFHSWSPDFTDPEITLSLYSDNILNTFSNTLFYRYNMNETSHGVGWNTSYGGFFPMLNAGLEYTFDRDVLTTRGPLKLNQLEARVGYNIPLNFTAGKTGKFLNFGSNYVFNRSMPTGRLKDSFLTSSSSYLHHFVTWSHQLPRAVQQIYPRFSFATSLHHRHRLSANGFQFIGTTQLALPSVKNHSIVLSASLQETDTMNVVFSNRFSNSRGYPDYYYTRMWRASGNYHMPLFYPDWGLANIVYFKRVRSNFFYDFSRVYSRNKTQSRDLRSAGVELFADTQWWNMLPLTIGVRYSYLLDNNFDPGLRRVRFEIALPLDLIPD